MIDGWHCLFLKLNKIDAFISGQSRKPCVSNSGNRKSWLFIAQISRRISQTNRRAQASQKPEPSMIFRKYQASQRLASFRTTEDVTAA
ncbi:hypothetical protein EYW47_39070 [Paraburkholderia silviterrae]|uniref:Uncharacterized protein n=1 Tax=Paraburkholderia silviterrae TaxID=2528715 RepID=A0A4V2ZXU4_9BURK|nr:hypothetical protein EYW47_39070 [Paraburkholderia silviterrae]